MASPDLKQLHSRIAGRAMPALLGATALLLLLLACRDAPTPPRARILVNGLGEAWTPADVVSPVDGWGGLPRTGHRSLPRGSEPPASDLYLESDGLRQLHVLMNSSGGLVRYDANGNPTLVTWLPPDMISLGRASALRGYAQPMEHLANGLELSCSGYLWVSVGEDSQRIALIDPRDYRIVRRITLGTDELPDAFWSECDGWIVGLSAKAGRVVVASISGTD